MHDVYETPFSSRYASREMQFLFSSDHKFRDLAAAVIALAEAEQELGLPITDSQLEELRAHADDINYDVAAAREKEVRHDVMAHVYAYGQQCPKAKGIIHLGATSCYVGDNTDLMILYDALRLIRKKLVCAIALLSRSRTNTRRSPPWPSPISSRRSPPLWANGRPFGRRSS